MKDLTEKQKLFCLEYLKDMNGTRAYQAVYKGVKNRDVAKVNASKLLTKPNVSAFIGAKKKEIESEKTAGLEEVIQYLTSVLRGEVESEDALSTKAGVSIFKKKPTGRERLEAAEKLMKYHKAYSDNTQVKVEVPIFIGESNLED